MNTVVSQVAYGVNASDALAAALREARRLEELLSRFLPDSDIGKLDRSAAPGTAVSLHSETATILASSLEISRLSGGVFDVTSAPLSSLWEVTSEHPAIPDKASIDEARKLVDYRDLIMSPTPENRPGALGLSEPTVTRYVKTSDLSNSAPESCERGSGISPRHGVLPERFRRKYGRVTARLARQGQMVDLGGIAKGYAADRMLDIYRKHKMVSGMVDLGGNVAVLGPKEDGSPWIIGIQNPDGVRGEYIGTLALSHGSVVTSGDYERSFEVDGKKYHHIIDPRTGYPAESGLRSVTVVAEDSMIADALSTALFILGMEKGLEMLRTFRTSRVGAGHNAEAIFVTSGRKVFLTSGISSTNTPLFSPLTELDIGSPTPVESN